MLRPPQIATGSASYAVRTRLQVTAAMHGRVIAGAAAERLIADLLRTDRGSYVRRAYATLTNSPISPDVSDDTVLGWFSRALGGGPGGAGSGHLVLVRMDGTEPAEQPSAERATPAQLVLRQLSQQGALDLQRAGYSYRVCVASEHARLPGRATLEVLSPAHAKAALLGCAEEQRYTQQRELLVAAAALTEPARQAEAQLLVLQRQRSYVREETSGKPLTPSQIREANENHWIAFQVLDDKGTPYANEGFELKLADGRMHTGTTDENGMVHVKGIVSGNCDLSFPELKHKSGPSAVS